MAKDITLFAPSNEAWSEYSVQNIIRSAHFPYIFLIYLFILYDKLNKYSYYKIFYRNSQKLKEILNLHLVRERLPMDAIIHNNLNQVIY